MREKVSRYPEVAFLRVEFGNLLARRGRLREALEQYEHAVATEPGWSRTWNNIGVVSQSLRESKNAISAYQKALAIDQYYAMGHYNLGVAYDSVGKYDKAMASYQRAIELDPGLLDIRKNPQIASNRHLAVIVLRTFIQRGSTVILPLDTAYPDPTFDPLE